MGCEHEKGSCVARGQAGHLAPTPCCADFAREAEDGIYWNGNAGRGWNIWTPASHAVDIKFCPFCGTKLPEPPR